MFIAPLRIGSKVRQAARTFLTAMRRREFDTVWNNWLSTNSIELISTTMWPLIAIKQDKIKEFIELELDDTLALSVQLNAEGVRSGLFEGLSQGLEDMRWYAFESKESMVIINETSALLIAKTPNITLIMPFARESETVFKVDLALLMVFSMEIRSSIFYTIGTASLELGRNKQALLYFDLGGNLLNYYQKLDRMFLNNVFVQQHITDERRIELDSEVNFATLAKSELERLASKPQVATSPIDMAVLLRNTFKRYEEITKVELSDQDINTLQMMSDIDLRKSVARILIGIDPMVAEREAEKPHTSVEIADMELAIKIENNIYHLCMPFKSGKESRSSFDVNVFHQIMRPFLLLRHCIVIFIAAKPCTQSLHNYVKQIRNNFGFSVEIIEDKMLARLLKINGLL
jgi:hypothetical protein